HSLHHPPTLLSYCYVHHRLLHSFPTRRSSDLAATITPLVATGVTTFTMGNLSMGSGSALTIAADAGSLANTAYNLTLGATTLARSEEHTSELQSRGHLVCRLLLEKKKNNKKRT